MAPGSSRPSGPSHRALASASGPGKGAGSSEALPGGSTTTEHALGPKQSVSYGVWNVRGFVQRDYCRLRENVITATDLDIVCLCETFLRNSEIISIEGYKWFGHNRTNISKRAVRGSGGVGVLVKESMFDRFSIDVVDKRHEDILWLACTQINNPDNTIFIGVCYLPPAASSRGDKSHDVFDTLRCQCLKFQDKGEILICGDFNARIGSLNDMSDVTQTRLYLPQRQIIDYTTNSHGKQLIDFLRDCNMVTLNGRFSSDKDNFTVISSVGKSVVDYAIVQADHFQNYSNFQVKTVLEILEYYSIPSDSPMPDHSLVCWECTYPELMPNRASPQCLNSAKLLPHVPIYCRDLNKPLFNSNHPVQVLEELITEIDSLTISSDTNNGGNDFIENYSAFYSLINKYFELKTRGVPGRP